jgi:cytochrome b involved in lipid metabolism
MMHQLYTWATAAFWLLVAAFWASSLWIPGAAELPRATATRVISAAELATHATPEHCWMAIRGDVYDLGEYLPNHPSRPSVIEPWCGKEATNAYDTKTRGRPHTKAADELLAKYRIGTFAPGGP